MARQFLLQRDKMAFQIGRAETALNEAKRLLTGRLARPRAALEQVDEALVQLAEAFVPIEYPDELVGDGTGAALPPFDGTEVRECPAS